MSPTYIHMMECLSVCVWLIRSHQIYYMFGFLLMVFIILIVTCCETAVIICYFHLRAEVC